MSMKQLWWMALALVFGASAQNDSANNEAIKESYRKLLKSKELILGSLTWSVCKPAFLNTENQLGHWDNYSYQNQWIDLGYNTGKALALNGNRKDTLAAQEFKLGLNIPIKKLMIGNRYQDLRGILLVPNIGFAYTSMTLGSDKVRGFKLAPMASLQFPFFGIDFKLNTDLRFPKANTMIKGFAIYPEIGIRVDGLYNLMNPQSVYTGHYRGTNTNTSTRYEEKTYKDGSDWVTETYKITTTTVENYDFDNYAMDVGPFVAIGPRYTFKNVPYSGPTSLVGLGYYLRAGLFGTDLLVDHGHIGFASSAKTPQTIYSPDPKNNNGIYKKDYRFTGTYSTTRLTGRVGIELMDLLFRMRYKQSKEGVTPTKFTRIMVGIGGGYATISQPHYNNSSSLARVDSIFNHDFTLLSTSRNHAKFASNTPFFTAFISIEVGAAQVSFEMYRYKNAYLANVGTVSLGYLLPYNRILKKYKSIRHMKQTIRR